MTVPSVIGIPWPTFAPNGVKDSEFLAYGKLFPDFCAFGTSYVPSATMICSAVYSAMKTLAVLSTVK